MNLESLLHRRKNSSLTASALVAILGATWLPQSVAEGLSLEEVVVTAQKRAESLQDVPIAVTAISGDKIADAGIQGLEDISSYVPNLKITSATGQSAGFIVIRGVGSGNNSGFEQSVGMFIDGIYAGRSRQFMVPFLDLAAVEVLKGPQGTLFGKNTVAGAISIQSAKPTNTLEGNVRLSYETEYDSKEASAVVSGPLTDYLSGRLAVKHNDKSGTVENLIRGTEEPTSDSRAIRGSLLFDVSDNIQVLSKLEYANVYNEGSIFQLSGIDGIWASPLGEYIHVDEVSPIEDGKLDNKNTLDSPNKEFVETTSINGLIKVDWDLENFSLTSITGYSDYESEVLADADFSDILFIETNPAETFDQTSQEFRLTSQGGGDLDFIVGLYLETQHLELSQKNNIDAGQLIGENIVDPFSPVNNFTQHSDTAAVYGQLTWQFTDTWSVTGGLRYAYEKKAALIELYTAEFDTYLVDHDLEAFANTLANRGTGVLDQERTTNNLSPTINFKWDYSDMAMAYFKVTRGYKSGGFNAAMASPDASSFEFDDEQVDGIELGTKMDLLDGAANLNVALFYNNFSDRQVSSFATDGFTVGNASESTSQGIEIDFKMIVNPALLFSFSVAYLESRYDDFADANCAPEQKLAYYNLGNPENQSDAVIDGCTVVAFEDNPSQYNNYIYTKDLTGKTTERAPRWSGSFVTNFNYPLGENMILLADLDVNYEDEYYMDQSLDSNTIQESYIKVNARLGLASRDQDWNIALVGKNLTDETTSGVSVGAPLFIGSYVATVDAPRTVAVEFGYRF